MCGKLTSTQIQGFQVVTQDLAGMDRWKTVVRWKGHL
jgi:hypothetical protein